jgi:hypothetical protein
LQLRSGFETLAAQVRALCANRFREEPFRWSGAGHGLALGFLFLAPFFGGLVPILAKAYDAIPLPIQRLTHHR